MSHIQPGPYGQPPQPPQRGGKGKTLGIAIGAVALIGAIGGGAYALLKDGGDDGPGAKPYTIALPDKLLDGQYAKKPEPKDDKPSDGRNDEILKKRGIVNGTEISGSYANDDRQTLYIGGAYGELADARKTVDAKIAILDKDLEQTSLPVEQGSVNKTELVTPWTEFHPAGFDGIVLKCSLKKATTTFTTFTNDRQYSQCVWGDGSAVGTVMHKVQKSTSILGRSLGPTVNSSGKAMSAKELSEATAKVRGEVRKDK